MYIKGSCYYHEPNRRGKYTCILDYAGKTKCLEGEDINTTPNKMTIHGAIDGIRALKEPCNITMYLPGEIGIKKGQRNKGTNKDLIIILLEEIEKGGHQVEYVYQNHEKIMARLAPFNSSPL